MYIHKCIYIYAYTCVYMYTFMYVHAHMHVYIYMYTYIYIYTCKYIHVHIFMYVCVWYIYLHVCICVKTPRGGQGSIPKKKFKKKILPRLFCLFLICTHCSTEIKPQKLMCVSGKWSQGSERPL